MFYDIVFFFKQKTAYELRISDWSSDVCSSDLKPHIWDEPDWVRALAGELRFDAVEGFWIRRPWTSSERCAPALQPAPETADAGAESDVDEAPEVAGPPPPVPVESQTVGIAQFFAPAGRRTLRRGTRPYSATVKARPGPDWKRTRLNSSH